MSKECQSIFEDVQRKGRKEGRKERGKEGSKRHLAVNLILIHFSFVGEKRVWSQRNGCNLFVDGSAVQFACFTGVGATRDGAVVVSGSLPHFLPYFRHRHPHRNLEIIEICSIWFSLVLLDSTPLSKFETSLKQPHGQIRRATQRIPILKKGSYNPHRILQESSKKKI